MAREAGPPGARFVSCIRLFACTVVVKPYSDPPDSARMFPRRCARAVQRRQIIPDPEEIKRRLSCSHRPGPQSSPSRELHDCPEPQPHCHDARSLLLPLLIAVANSNSVSRRSVEVQSVALHAPGSSAGPRPIIPFVRRTPRISCGAGARRRTRRPPPLLRAMAADARRRQLHPVVLRHLSNG